MAPFKLLLTDDHTILQHGLTMAFAADQRFKVVGMANSGQEAIFMVETHRPDLILMDVSMPDMNGMETTRQILKKYPEIKIVALSMHAEKLYIKEMIRAGALGYILKSCAFDELLSGITEVLAGKRFFCQALRDLVREEELMEPRQKKKDSVFSILSQREREVLQLIAEGRTSKEISDKLSISPKTVDIHRNNLKKKLSIYNIAGLTKFAISKGLTSPEL